MVHMFPKSHRGNKLTGQLKVYIYRRVGPLGPQLTKSLNLNFPTQPWCGLVIVMLMRIQYKSSVRNSTCFSRCFACFTREYLNVFAIAWPACAFFTNIQMAEKCKQEDVLKVQKPLMPATAGQIRVHLDLKQALL